MKTIKQIAVELGVSKQTVRDRIAKLGLQSTLQKNGNSFAIDEKQEAMIKQDFLQISQSESQSSLQSESQSTLHLALQLLERQNEQLSNELEIKNKQIDDLTNALANVSDSLKVAQGLHIGTMQQVYLPEVSDEKPHKKIWDIFKKR